MKSSYSICYGTSLETEQPPLEMMPVYNDLSSEMGKILLEGLDALASIDTSPEPAGIKHDRANSAASKKGRRSKRDSKSVAEYIYTPSAEVRQKFARLSADLIKAVERGE